MTSLPSLKQAIKDACIREVQADHSARALRQWRSNLISNLTQQSLGRENIILACFIRIIIKLSHIKLLI